MTRFFFVHWYFLKYAWNIVINVPFHLKWNSGFCVFKSARFCCVVVHFCLKIFAAFSAIQIVLWKKSDCTAKLTINGVLYDFWFWTLHDNDLHAAGCTCMCTYLRLLHLIIWCVTIVSILHRTTTNSLSLYLHIC